MVKIPGVDPLSEGTIRRKRRKSRTEDPGKKVPSATISVAPTDEVIVEGEPETQVSEASTDVPAAQPSTDLTVAAPAGTPASVPSTTSTASGTGTVAKSSGAKPKPKLQVPKEDFDATYLKINQCVCGYKGADGSALRIHTKNQHPHSYYRCWGLLKSTTSGQERHCPFETEDQGVMRRHYRTKHLGLYYRQCSAEKCTGGRNSRHFMSDNPDAVAKHMAKEHGEAAKLTCPHCKKYVANAKYMMERHMQACETKDKKVKFHHCEECRKGFRDWDTFSHHKVHMHSRIPDSTAGWYFCGECDKKFSASSSRARHIRKAHTPAGEKSG